MDAGMAEDATDEAVADDDIKVRASQAGSEEGVVEAAQDDAAEMMEAAQDDAAEMMEDVQEGTEELMDAAEDKASDVMKEKMEMHGSDY